MEQASSERTGLPRPYNNRAKQYGLGVRMPSPCVIYDNRDNHERPDLLCHGVLLPLRDPDDCSNVLASNFCMDNCL